MPDIQFHFLGAPDPRKTVRHAIDTVTGQESALKFCDPARERREEMSLVRLKHRNIVSVRGIWWDPEARKNCLVMEWINGAPLSECHRKLQFDQKIVVIRSLLAGMEHAHGRGVIHRDIKPANVMIEQPGGRVVLVDFDVAKTRGFDITEKGMQIGTPAYMSSEATSGQDLDERSDICSLGIVFYELLTGSNPFKADVETLVRAAKLLPPPPSAISSKAPQALDGVVLKAIAKKATERYQTAAEFDAAIVQALHLDGPLEQTVILPLPRARKPKAPVPSLKAAPVPDRVPYPPGPPSNHQTPRKSIDPGKDMPSKRTRITVPSPTARNRPWLHRVAACLIGVGVIALLLLV